MKPTAQQRRCEHYFLSDTAACVFCGLVPDDEEDRGPAVCPNCGEAGDPGHHLMDDPVFKGYVCFGKDSEG